MVSQKCKNIISSRIDLYAEYYKNTETQMDQNKDVMKVEIPN